VPRQKQAAARDDDIVVHDERQVLTLRLPRAPNAPTMPPCLALACPLNR